MRSSTSSSERRLPRLHWNTVLTGGAAAAVIFICFMEIGLTLHGILPSVADSSRLWGQQRARADDLGPAALALVGDSRMLLDMDSATLRQSSGLEPVQLAIEGSSFVPVLAGLAADPGFRGSVIVDLDVKTLATPAVYDAAYAYEHDYDLNQGRRIGDYRLIENYLSDELHSHLRSYADGSRPLSALLMRVIRKPDPVQYLKMLPDREVLADYHRPPMPYLYYFRALRNLDGSRDLPSGLSYAQIGAKIEAGIAALQPVDNTHFLATLVGVSAMVDAIESRGGRVFFVKFPTSGYVKQADDRRYPRGLFWDRFVDGVSAPTIDFNDLAAATAFTCPDGSHLDYRSRAAFTHALARALHLDTSGS